MKNWKIGSSFLASLFIATFFNQVFSQVTSQWGERFTRNMVSQETNLPSTFDPRSGENIKWTASLGSHAYATPVIAGGKVLIGANNADERDPKHKGDLFGKARYHFIKWNPQ